MIEFRPAVVRRARWGLAGVFFVNGAIFVNPGSPSLAATRCVAVLELGGARPAVTLVPLPPYSPELYPVERIWLYLRERFLSLRVFRDYRAIVDACCTAWNCLVAEPGRIRSLCNQPWITNVSS